MKNKTCTILFLVTGLILLAGVLAPMATAREGVWRADRASPAAAPRLGSEMQISTPSTPTDADRYRPAVAYNYVRGQYLVVWHNTWPGGHRDIYAQRVSDTGKLVGSWFAITAGPNDRAQPAVAYNATNDEYLITWMYNANGDGNTYEIWGRIIAWNNSYQKPEFRIIQWTDRSFWTPRVAWNSYRNEYMVIWNAFDTSGGFPGNPNDVAGSRISNGGSILGTYIFTSGTPPYQADIAYNVAMDEYLVVFVRVYSSVPPATANDIYAIRVSWNGSVVNPPGAIGICTDLYNQSAPAVTTNEQDRYMVVWQSEYLGDSTDNDIYAREFYATGSPVGSKFSLATSSDDETAPDVAANGATREWLAVWQRATSAGKVIRALRWGSGVTTYGFEVAAAAFWDHEKPAVAADIPGYLIVYEADSSDPTVYRHIYGRLWWPEAVYLPLILRNKS